MCLNCIPLPLLKGGHYVKEKSEFMNHSSIALQAGLCLCLWEAVWLMFRVLFMISLAFGDGPFFLMQFLSSFFFFFFPNRQIIS